MESINSMIDAYIHTRYGNSDNYTYLLERLNGLSNEIYKLKILDKYSGVTKELCVFRKFGKLSAMVDRNLEGNIIDQLSKEGLTPKTIFSELKCCRFEEYIDDSDVVDKDTARSEYFIERITTLLVFYSTLSVIYDYHMVNQSIDGLDRIDIKIQQIYDHIHTRLKIDKDRNIYDSLVKMSDKANENFLSFSDKFLKFYFSQKDHSEIDQSIYTQFEKFSYYVKNFKNLFLKVFPSKGLLVLNHNDVHKLNLLCIEGRDKIYILDHEYAGLNLIGIDIVNFLIETNYDYTIDVFPYYEYSPELIDLQAYYKIFLKFVDEFILKHQQVSARVTEEIEKYMEEIKNFEYFLRLVRVVSLFWLSWSAVKIDFDAFEKKKSFDYFKHAMDRISLFETADKIWYNQKICFNKK